MTRPGAGPPGSPQDTAFATKPALARRMITRALDAGVPAAWVAGDEVYGSDPDLRAELEERRHRATSWPWPAITRSPSRPGNCRADELAACLPRTALAAVLRRARRQGPPLLRLGLIGLDPAPARDHHWLLIRRSRRTGELAFYRCYAPRPVPLATLVQVAGTRWTVEENFQAGKELTGLDQHQVRRWTSWYRWVTLAMLAAAFLTITAAAEHSPPPARRPDPADPQRDQPPAHRHDHPARHARRPADLVQLAPAPPAPRPDQPLPTASHRRTMKITIYSWSIRALGVVHPAVPGHVGAVFRQRNECRHRVQHGGRVRPSLRRLQLRLFRWAQLVLDALAQLGVPAPVDSPQDVTETRIVVWRHRGRKTRYGSSGSPA